MILINFDFFHEWAPEFVRSLLVNNTEFWLCLVSTLIKRIVLLVKKLIHIILAPNVNEFCVSSIKAIKKISLSRRALLLIFLTKCNPYLRIEKAFHLESKHLMNISPGDPLLTKISICA